MSEILQALGKPFPREAIKQRAGGGNRKLDYLETHTVIRRLNEAAGNWSFAVKSMELHGEVWVVMGELSIPGLGTRPGIGVQRISERQRDASEDLIKGAVSDALKKAATLFGVGLELYGPDYEDDRPSQRQTPPKASKPRREERPGPHGQISRDKAKALYQQARDAGWSDADITTWLRDHAITDADAMGVRAFGNLTEDQASTFKRDIVNFPKPRAVDPELDAYDEEGDA